MSSSLSSLHFGHYKAVIDNDKLSEMHSVFVDIVVNLGYSPKRWQKGLTVMLEKKCGVILISKLRAILLMEADSNFANKTIFGWRMMHFAEDRNDIAGECAGSHKHHEAIDVALNRWLFCDIARQKKCSAAITGADLVQCYDRIAHLIASLGSQCWGVPVNAITCLLTTIQLMVFLLHMAHGDSTVSYSPTHIKLLVKVMVGDLFLSVSSPCVGYMHGMGFAARLISAFSTMIFCIIGILYVDDTDLFAIAVYPSENAERVGALYAGYDISLARLPSCHWRRFEILTNAVGPPLVFIGTLTGNGIIVWILGCQSAFQTLQGLYRLSNVSLHWRQPPLWGWFRQRTVTCSTKWQLSWQLPMMWVIVSIIGIFQNI
jgi:hypothetical protein